jgi:hypothetical protein
MKGARERRFSGFLIQLGIFVCAVATPTYVFAVQDSACITCHEKTAASSKTAENRAIRYSGAELKDSVHRVVHCVECHHDASTYPHKSASKPVDCSRCHGDVARQYERSVHGVAANKGDKDAPRCTSCHGDGHHIYGVSDPRSPMSRSRLVRECVRCHTDARVEKTHNLPSPELIKAYENSVHGRLAQLGGRTQVALCSDCHGVHLILNPKDPESRMNRANIPSVCGRCHVQIYNEYKVSIHGRALARGNLESPGCTDCHGEHTLAMVTDPAAPVFRANVAKTCAGCHENQTIIAKYGLPSDRYSSYSGSFHGIAIKYGNLSAANCTSCHEIHRILPSSEAESSVSVQNLPRTCGKCHPGMRDVAAIGRIHVEATKGSSTGMYIVRRFYRWFIGVLMVLFLGYIVLDVYGRISRRRRNDR